MPPTTRIPATMHNGGTFSMTLLNLTSAHFLGRSKNYTEVIFLTCTNKTAENYHAVSRCPDIQAGADNLWPWINLALKSRTCCSKWFMYVVGTSSKIHFNQKKWCGVKTSLWVRVSIVAKGLDSQSKKVSSNPACALKQGTFIMLASSVDRDVNGGTAGQNWLSDFRR